MAIVVEGGEEQAEPQGIVLPGVPAFRGKVLGVTQHDAFGAQTAQVVVADEITRTIVVVPTNLVRSWTEG